MAESIKLKNNKYWDSTGITHNKELLSTKIINSSGSNSNGNWIKFEDGTMIITQKVYASNSTYVTMGTLKRVGLGIPPDFPIAFKDPPNVQFTLCNCWLAWLMGTSATPTVTNATARNFIPIASAETQTLTNAEINILAIGKWK